ncbi:MAG: hypothetical protein HQL67_10785 [Magnetococcales bacterium]|nr:hypothetical protein [Magnetococcales bacterium]
MNRHCIFHFRTWRLAVLIALVVCNPISGYADDTPGVIKDPLLLLKSLEERRLNLDERAKELEIRENDLIRLEEKLAKRIENLEKLRDVIQKDLTKEKEIDAANIARLSKIYSSMKVKSAALGLQSIDQDTAVKVLKVMSEKSAGKILGKMQGGNAIALANELGVSIAEKRNREE